MSSMRRSSLATSWIVSALLTAALVIAAPCLAWAQAPPTTQPHPAIGDADCTSCHNCAAPTVQERCLRECTRPEKHSIDEMLAGKQGPNVVILGDLADRYLPVPFDHQGHAKMAAMGKGCVACHHYTPEGSAHPACKTCHEISPIRADISKPGLKGAYHRQCLGCHRDWSDETRCVVCHQARTGASERESTPTPGDLLGRMHPPIPKPDELLYDTAREGHSPTQVLFRHKFHVEQYGLTCADCHQKENCQSCHKSAEPSPSPATRPLRAHHEPCLKCHENADVDQPGVSCDRCHFANGATAPRPFVHADTGWPLYRFHKKLDCRACHSQAPYVKPVEDGDDCESCHKSWSADEFDHAVTGQVLDENHAGQDCEFCHADGKFSVKPTCDECHDADEGISFPARRPGPVRTAD